MSTQSKSADGLGATVPSSSERAEQLIERLLKGGTHLGNAIAGYRDNDNHRSAEGLAEAATAMLDAADALVTMVPGSVYLSAVRGRQEFRIALRAARAVNAELVSALEAIVDNYANQDVSHQSFRVQAYEVAIAALSKASGGAPGSGGRDE